MTQASLSVPYRPQEVTAGARPLRLRQVAVSLTLATVTVLIVASPSLARWAEDLDVGTVNDLIVAVASSWDRWLHLLGVAIPFDYLRDAFERFKSLS